MKKIKNIITAFLLISIALLTIVSAWLFISPNSSQTAEAATQDDLVFNESGGKYIVRAKSKSISGDLIIPATYNGKAVDNIGYGAFEGCKNLKSVTIPDSVTYISGRAFYGCQLTNLTLGNKIGYIDKDAFTSFKVENIYIKSMSAWCQIKFYPSNATSANPIKSETNLYLNNELVTDLKNITEINAIQNDAFSLYSKFENLTIPNSVTSIGEYAFSRCENLKSVTIPESVTTIGYGAFTACNDLVTITYEGTRAAWENVTKKPYAIPDSVQIICTGEVPNEISTGIEDYGVTNKNITVIYSGYEVQGYYSNSASSMPDSANTPFDSGHSFKEEGNYLVEARNKYSASAYLHFTIDRTPPTGSLNGVEDKGFTNGEVTFTWTEEGATATLNGTRYNSGASISEEREHTIVLTDKAGNSTTYKFTIDKTPPTGSLNGVEDKGFTNGEVTFTWTEEGATATLNGVGYRSGVLISEEREHTIVLTDKAGNSTTYTFTIDRTPPKIAPFTQYVHDKFTLTAEDSAAGVSHWEYKHNGGELNSAVGNAVSIGGGEENNGEWQIRAYDKAGNKSAWVTVYHAFRNNFGNSTEIYNLFTVPSYYVVSLSQKKYANCFGSYSFADYESALKFAKSKEWECRVIDVDGSSWNYVTPNNENARMIYKDRQELDTTIEKYAVKNISDRKVLGPNGATLNNPTDSSLITRDDALAVQLVDLPELLSDYSDYKYMLALGNYIIKRPDSIVEGNKSTFKIKLISDGISIREEVEKPMEYGVSLDTVCQEEGWYLVTESDLCGNIERYLIFIDVQHPEINAHVAYGNGGQEDIKVDESYVNGHSETMRYVEFSVSSITDNIDDYAFVLIKGRNLEDVRYVSTDKLPVLSYDNGYYGAYTITIYDRSHNTFSFVIYVAGEAPSLKNSSLTNETAVTFTVQINDSYNEISDIKFFKVLFDGTEERIYTDSFGTEVNAQNLVYKMNVGGKYLFEFTDLYGRIVRTKPLFYMKGLPSATLRGVKDGGLTKNDVSVLFDKNATLELFIYSDGEWQITENYELSEGVSVNTVSVAAGEETTAIYKVLLYVTEDRNLFTEYTFEIDGILPIVEVKTESFENVEPDTVITDNFFLTWSESGYTAYYKKQGAISDSKYVKETLISAAGTYEFTIRDRAYNEVTFTVTLDNLVNYTLEGSYILSEDGGYITRGYFKLTINEPYSVFNVISSNGIAVRNGQKLDTDGNYTVHVEDSYGNELNLELIIDKLPPVPVITTLSGVSLKDGSRTREPFRVGCEEKEINITYSDGNGFYAYDGRLIESAGTYLFKLVDVVGNITEVTISVDLVVSYRVEGNYTIFDGNYYSKFRVQVVALEELTTFSISLRETEEVNDENFVNAEGIYDVRLVDLAGNEAVFSIIIDRTAPTAIVKTLSGKELSGDILTNEAFTVECDEEDATIKYTFEGITESYDGKQLEKSGIYIFSVKDKLGNVYTFTVEIERITNYRIEGDYIKVGNEYLSNSWLQVVVNEPTELFEITADMVKLPDASQRISKEGTYTVRIRDLAGNEVSFTLVIDKTAPEVRFETLSGKLLDSGASTNEPVRIICEEENANVSYKLNAGSTMKYSGGYLTEEGKYTVIVADLLGTASEHSVTIDITVKIKINGTYVIDSADKYISKNWLAVSAEESMRQFYIRSRDGADYATDQKITDEGEYDCVAMDELGNRLELILVIDKTAPIISLAGVVEGGATNSTVSAYVESYNQIFYRYNGSEKITAYDGISFDVEGDYVVIATDIVGNTSSALFSIDKHVDVLPDMEIVYGQLITNHISFKFGENVTASLVHDGVESTYLHGIISEIGSYALKVSDECGNSTAFAWEIIPEKAKSFSIVIPDGFEVVCELNGELYDAGISGDKIALTISGDYELLFAKEDISFILEITVDNVAPSVEVETTRKSIIISNPNKENMTYTLYYNGKPTAFNLKNSAEITQVGSYRLVCTDELGNVTEYIFELSYLSDISIVLICVVSALVVLGIVAIIAFRFKRKIF